MKPSETHTNYGVSDIYVNAGCNPDTITHNIAYQCFVPNSFTPNGDGTADYFYPEITGASGMDLRIYNSSNVEVFRTGIMNVYFYGWDGKVNGKQAPSGVYVYTLKTHETCRNIEHSYNGECNLER